MLLGELMQDIDRKAIKRFLDVHPQSYVSEKY